MRSMRGLLHTGGPAQRRAEKWLPRPERKQIQRYRRQNIPADRVDTEVMPIGEEHKALMSCNFGPRMITTYLLPVIQNLPADWLELAGLAADIIGLSHPVHIEQLNWAVSSLGREHYLLLQPTGFITYRRLPGSQVEMLKRIDF